MEVELKRLEDLSEAIVQDFAMMRKREEEMRDTNGRYINVCNKVCTNLFPYFFRINQQPCSVLQYFQYVLPSWTGHLASFVPEKVLQGQKVDRMI
jgi:hypothetical protein